NRGLSRRRDQDDSLKRGASLSTPFHKSDHVCCVDFRFWRGATRKHPSQWRCDRGATKPEPKSDATLRAAVLFGPDFVAHSLQTAEGYARRSRLGWAKNPSPQTWSYLWNGVPGEAGPQGLSGRCAPRPAHARRDRIARAALNSAFISPSVPIVTRKESRVSG